MIKVKSMFGAVAILVAAGALWSVMGPMRQPLAERSVEGRVITAEVTMEPYGTFGATLNSESSVHGPRLHTRAGATYSQMYAETFTMVKGETLTLYLTAAATIQAHRRTLTCRIKDQGKTVRSQPLTVRANQPGQAVACDLTVYN